MVDIYSSHKQEIPAKSIKLVTNNSSPQNYTPCGVPNCLSCLNYYLLVVISHQSFVPFSEKQKMPAPKCIGVMGLIWLEHDNTMISVPTLIPLNHYQNHFCVHLLVMSSSRVFAGPGWSAQSAVQSMEKFVSCIVSLVSHRVLDKAEWPREHHTQAQQSTFKYPMIPR